MLLLAIYEMECLPHLLYKSENFCEIFFKPFEEPFLLHLAVRRLVSQDARGKKLRFTNYICNRNYFKNEFKKMKITALNYIGFHTHEHIEI